MVRKAPQLELAINPSTLRSRRRRAKMTANERTREKSKYAVKRREDLVLVLAPDLRCSLCEAQMTHPRELTIDHKDGITWDHDGLNMGRRVARYWREYNSGVRLLALCGMCNSTDGGYRRHGLDNPYEAGGHDPDDPPF